MIGAWRKQQRCVGIDIGSSVIKMVDLVRKDRSYRVNAYAIVPLADDVVIDKKINQPEVVVAALSQFYAHSKQRHVQAVVALPDNLVFRKVVSMDGDLNHTDIEAMIELDGARYIPYAIDEVNYDFQVLPNVKENSQEQEVLIVAARTDDVEQRVDVCEEVGFKVTTVDMQSYALQHVLPLLAEDGSASNTQTINGIMTIGSNDISLCVFAGDQLIYNQEVAFNGHQLIEQICQRYEMTIEQAFYALRHNELDKEFHTTIADPFIHLLGEDILRIIQFYESTTDAANIQQLYLAGGLIASLPQITGYIADEYKLPVKTASSPFKQMQTLKTIDQQALLQDGPCLLTATGLAIRGLHQ